MVFNSLTFLVFFAGVLLVHNLPLSWGTRKRNLIIASYLFYAAWNPPFVVLIWISTLIDWYAARGIGRSERVGRRRMLLLVSLGTNLGLLAFFKYGGFLLANCAALLRLCGVVWQPAAPSIILPVGISFYTFQTLSYTIDVYRGRMAPWKSFTDFALYVTFFPQLVAGPIVRATDFLPQCATPRRVTGAQFAWGLTLLLIGLGQKVICADACLAPVVEQVFAHAQDAGRLDAWIGTLAFAVQIYFDFAGYTACALGVALCLGFTLPPNFRYPYAACGFSDFWQRWHISLSTWLRDYLYIPLGGNRRGPRRTLINLMLTMLLGGLWHGAAWMFVIWGGLHGAFLIGERTLRRWVPERFRQAWGGRLLGTVATFLLVCVAWVFFRAPDVATALRLLTTMVSGNVDRLWLGDTAAAVALMVIFGTLTWHVLMRNGTLEDVFARTPWPVRSVVLATLLVALAVNQESASAFIYFQF